MKYYSEKLDKMFDTQMDLEKEEYRAEQKERDAAVESAIRKSHEVATKKKKLAKEVEQKAEELVSKRNSYLERKKEIISKLGDYVEELRKELHEKYSDVEEAEKSYINSLYEFNKLYGPYKKNITVEESNELMGNATKFINSRFLDMLNW